MNPAIALEDARLAFGSLRVLDALGLEVPRGQAVALIGPSGAGKTTLLRVLAGMLPLDSGSVRVEGPVGLLYQNDALVPGLRTVHNVLIGRLGRWSLWKSLVSLVFPRELDRARSALRAVDLEDKLWAPIGTLSGGQRQRVALARLLAQDPRVVLADEPASSLDPRLRRQVLDLLLRLSRERGATLIVSLHEMDLVRTGFDRLLALVGGEWFYDGPPEGLSEAERRRLFAGDDSAGGRDPSEATLAES